MNSHIRKYTATLLLLVFSYTVIPTPLFHSLFAGHTDTCENYCDYYHKNAGTHIEGSQTHCDIFKTITPLYDAVVLNHDFIISALVISEYKTGEVITSSSSALPILPARAPPVA
jgi:hypothetical protein